MEAGEPGQHVQRGGVDGDVRGAARQQLRALAGDVLRLHQKGHRHAPGIQSAANDQRALRDEEGVGRIGPVHQLVFGGAGVDIQRRVGKVVYLDDMSHSERSLYNTYRKSIAFYGEKNKGRHRPSLVFVRLRICAERRENLYLEASSLAARFLPYMQQATT